MPELQSLLFSHEARLKAFVPSPVMHLTTVSDASSFVNRASAHYCFIQWMVHEAARC